jgi:cyclopropane fatty-acyl-phospholipid synthase-like methyltransferase
MTTILKKASLASSLCLAMQDPKPFATLEKEYTPLYCSQLEAAYGVGMMSEGGPDATELMFDGIALDKKKALDIGSGLGGVAFYLAEKYEMNITGLEVNPWMVEESKKRSSEFQHQRVDFVLSHSNIQWPFQKESFDLIYSKGVFTHLEVKEEVLLECHCALKNEGLLIITDWLSSDDRKWGPNIERLVELEHLVLYPESEAGYIDLFTKNGFTVLSVRDDSLEYSNFNQKTIDRLRDYIRLDALVKCFSNRDEILAAIEGYESIKKALDIGELRVLRFVTQKM